jgi:hypothetical protein
METAVERAGAYEYVRALRRLGPSKFFGFDERPLRSPQPATQRQPSGERALERSTVCRCSVSREHDLDWQREQRAQPLDDLLARHAGGREAVVLEHMPSGATAALVAPASIGLAVPASSARLGR